MSIEQIRRQHKVPAKIGGKIRYTDQCGHVWEGVIEDAKYGYLHVYLNTPTGRKAILNPKWNIEYLD